MNYFVKITVSLLFCLNFHFIRAEKNDIDSLKGILPGATAAEKIKINYQIGSQFFSSLPDSSIHYFNEALRLSQEMGNDTVAGKCLYRIGILDFNSGAYEKSIANLFSALKIFERLQEKSRTLLCLQYLGMAYNEQGMYGEALDYAKQSLKFPGR
jgi:tetratricopeptide (TPR) repeat protein